MNETESIWAILPLKSPKFAKQRLKEVLSVVERKALFFAMFKDVMIALSETERLDGIAVVTCDLSVEMFANSFGARIIKTKTDIGLSESVTLAAEKLAADGIKNVVILPGDVPLVNAREIDKICAHFIFSKKMILIPDNAKGGTNGIFCSLPAEIPFAFGVDSFELHKTIAVDFGVPFEALEIASFGLDIDLPEDLREFALLDLELETTSFLNKRGITQRLTRPKLWANFTAEEKSSDEMFL